MPGEGNLMNTMEVVLKNHNVSYLDLHINHAPLLYKYLEPWYNYCSAFASNVEGLISRSYQPNAYIEKCVVIPFNG